MRMMRFQRSEDVIRQPRTSFRLFAFLALRQHQASESYSPKHQYIEERPAHMNEMWKRRQGARWRATRRGEELYMKQKSCDRVAGLQHGMSPGTHETKQPFDIGVRAEKRTIGRRETHHFS